MRIFRAEEFIDPSTGIMFSYTVGLRPGRQKHGHEFHEMVFVRVGPIRHCAGGRAEQLHDNSLVFVRAGDIHSVHGATKAYDCELVTILFTDDTLRAALDYLGTPQARKGYLRPDRPPTFSVSVAEGETIAANLLRIGRHAARRTPETNALWRATLADLLVRFFLDRQSPARADMPEWLRRTLQAMEEPENLVEGLDAMRRIASRSPQHLSAVSREFLGKTPTRYINELRAHRAADLLASTERDVLHVGLDCGFGSSSNFYRVFETVFGTTPGRYRKDVRRGDLHSPA